MSENWKKKLAIAAPFILSLFPAVSFAFKVFSLKAFISFYLACVTFFSLINIATYSLYYYDKKQAQLGRWRISEKTLLTCSILGGWPAALYVMEKIRHKSSKRSFLSMHWLSIITHLIGTGYIILFSGLFQ